MLLKAQSLAAARSALFKNLDCFDCAVQAHEHARAVLLLSARNAMCVPNLRHVKQTPQARSWLTTYEHITDYA